MTSENKIPGLTLTVLISLFVHLTLFTAVTSPDLNKKKQLSEIMRNSGRGDSINRDIIVNINQDDEKEMTRKTLLSDRDSKAKGYITTKKGDRWLNNSLDFKLLKGTRGKDISSTGNKKDNLILARDSEFSVIIDRSGESDSGGDGDALRILIPDKNDVNMNNAIYYSNTGAFSFNTAKFKHFHYFKNMKDKIAAHWFPPLLANAILLGYAPGRTRIMAIQNQRVKIYFTMNRNGDVLDVVILDSMNNKPLDISCVESIRLSKNFGRVPDDIKGDVIVIPFIFGYYSN